MSSQFYDVCYPSYHWELVTPELLVLAFAAAR